MYFAVQSVCRVNVMSLVMAYLAHMLTLMMCRDSCDEIDASLTL